MHEKYIERLIIRHLDILILSKELPHLSPSPFSLILLEVASPLQHARLLLLKLRTFVLGSLFVVISSKVICVELLGVGSPVQCARWKIT